ncbi:hypothetical protein D3C86_2186250 [compost metagenome]
MSLQGKSSLPHAQARGLNITGIQRQPDQHDKQHTDLQRRQRRVRQLKVITFPEVDAGKAEEHQGRTADKRSARQMEQSEQ